jgi:transposase
LIDSQSVKTTGAAEDRGIDGGKKIKGRKRHIVTDTQDHLLYVKVHAANIHDTVAGCNVFKKALRSYPSLKGVCADAGYRKTMENFVQDVLKKTITISKRIVPNFVILPQRWAVERTFAWLNHARRLSEDYETTLKSAENIIMIAHSMILIRRIA